MSLEEVAEALREARDSLTVEEKRRLYQVRAPRDYGGWAIEVADRYWPEQPEERLSFLNVCGRPHVASYGMAERYMGDDMAYDNLAAAVRGLPDERAEALVGECRDEAARLEGEELAHLAGMIENLAAFIEQARATI